MISTLDEINKVFVLIESIGGLLSGKESTCQAGDMGLIPGFGRSPGEGNSNPLQYSWLGNPMSREEPQGPQSKESSST